MTSTRRVFLKQAAKVALGTVPAISGLSAITTRAWASALASDSDFNFVLFRVIGGMDSLLSLHPWTEDSSKFSEEDLWLTYHRSEIQSAPGTQISLGPSAAAIAPFAQNMAIVRGIYMGASDLGHPAAMQHISSARTQESAAHLAALFGEKMSDSARFVVTNTSIQRGTVPAFPVILTQALKEMGDVADFTTTSSLDIYQNKQLAVNRYLDLLRQKPKLIKFAEVLRERQRTVPASEGVLDENIALASLAAGLSRVAQIDLIDQARDLDTHGGHGNHREFQRVRWDRIAGFLQGLRENGLMEKTLVAVVTEFNRSPGKNGAAGKDHNYTDNAVALFGRGLNGGRAIGDHKLYLRSETNPVALWAGSFLDYKSGKVSELDALQAIVAKQNSGKLRLPEHVDLIRPTDLWATVARSLTPDVIRNLAPESRIIPGLFRSEFVRA